VSASDATLEPDEPWLHVVLIEPEIPPNTGSIGRLCLGTGCRLHLVKPLGFSIDEKAVRRAGLDYWKHVDLAVHESFEEVLERLAGRSFVFTSAREGVPYTVHRFVRGEVLVFGRESTGLPERFHERYAGQFIRIPTPGPIRSLNLANAASVVVYEGLRQLRPELFYPGS
jgi:tRNA (cytidine/uridine-2'-O-)-methyltransferase